MTQLHIREWGSGERTAVLVHMLTSASTTWWRVGPYLAERGYHVIAPDLPGHGKSPRLAGYTIDAFTEALVTAVPQGPDLAIGHSFGAIHLARGIDRIKPAQAIYVEPAWIKSGPPERFAFYRNMKRNWTLDDVRAECPQWREEAQLARYEAIVDWDDDTLNAIVGFPGYEPAKPESPALVLRGNPSNVVPPARAEQLTAEGFEVRTVESGHVIHNDNFDGFVEAIQDRIGPARI